MNNNQLLKLYREALWKMEDTKNHFVFCDWSDFRDLIELEIHRRMGTVWSTLELATMHRTAFDALPLPYQNDNCLEFFINEKLQLCCHPKIDQVFALGHWESIFDEGTCSWSGIH